MTFDWKNIASRLWREKRDAERAANEMIEWNERQLHKDLDKVGVPTSAYYPGGCYDGSIARVRWLVEQLEAKPSDERYVPKRAFDTAIQTRDMYAKENRELRARTEAAEARVRELEAALREEIDDIEEQATADEHGWSIRDGHNRFNEGAAFALREVAGRLRAILQAVGAPTKGEAKP